MQATASEIRKRYRRQVECGDLEYTIRYLGITELAAKGINLDLAVEVRNKTRAGEQVSPEQVSEVLRFRDQIVALGTVAPQVVSGGGPAGEDQVHVDELPEEHKGALFAAILEFAGLTEEEKQKVRP